VINLRPLVLLVFVTIVLPAGYGQERRQQLPITGRVIDTAGRPVAGTFVDLVPVGSPVKSALRHETNEEGKFSFDGLSTGAYSLLVEDLSKLDFFTDVQSDNFAGPRFWRPGDFAELVVPIEKPGIITGRVTGPTGEPVVEAIVRAFKVRDRQGRRVQSLSPLGDTIWQRKTDDRGIYRIWWLDPGAYMISVGGAPSGGLTFRAPSPTDYDNDAPTYYSGSPLGEPTAVTVGPQAEVNGIDIQYRGGSGHAISGTLSWKPASGSGSTRVYLTNAATGAQQSDYLLNDRPPSFTFAKLPDGDYDIVAIADMPGHQDEIASRTVRATVKGTDLTGITLEPMAFASAAGRIVIDSTSDQTYKQDCHGKRPAVIEEVVLVLKGDPATLGPSSMERHDRSAFALAVDSNGAFAAPRLNPGTYSISADLPDDRLYLSAITAPAPASRAVSASGGLTIKGGEHVSPLVISLRMGAATLNGRIALPELAAPLSSVRVYLVPLDPAEADNPLRFGETSIKAGGAFTFAHVAPGQYKVLARPVAEGVERQLGETRQGRALLRRAAQRNGVKIQLQQCQKLVDLALKYTEGQLTLGQ